MRTYSTPIGELPSVTWILGETVTKPWMPNYIKKWARECFWDMVNSRKINELQPDCDDTECDLECVDIGYYCDKVEDGFFPLIEISDIQYCLDAHKRHSDKALEIGSLVHSAIESYHKVWDDDEWFAYAMLHYPEDKGLIEKAVTYIAFLKEFYPDYYQIIATYLMAIKDNNIDILESEQTVWHPMGYAGTLDLICEMDGKLWIGDIKTFESKEYKSGKPKKPLFKKEHYAQTAAYMKAYNHIVDIKNNKEDFMSWINGGGYELCRKDGKSQYIHRIVMEKKLGRQLKENECVHHINGNKLDNRPGNLELMNYSEHGKLHPRECKSIIGDAKRCPRCDKWLPFDKFSKNKNRVGGLASYCKKCERNYKTEKYFGHDSKQRMVKAQNRFILWLDKRQQDNFYLEIIPEEKNDVHWDMWCTAFNHWRAWK
jgi:hypothetical protein